MDQAEEQERRWESNDSPEIPDTRKTHMRHPQPRFWGERKRKDRRGGVEWSGGGRGGGRGGVGCGITPAIQN